MPPITHDLVENIIQEVIRHFAVTIYQGINENPKRTIINPALSEIETQDIKAIANCAANQIALHLERKLQEREAVQV